MRDYERGLVLACLQRYGLATLPLLQHRLPKLDSGRITAALTHLSEIGAVLVGDNGAEDALARRRVFSAVPA